MHNDVDKINAHDQEFKIVKRSGRNKNGRRNGDGYLFKRGRHYYIEIQVNGQRKVKSLRTSIKDQAIARAKDYLKPVEAISKEEMTMHIAMARGLTSEKTILLRDVWKLYIGSANRPDSGPRTLKDYQFKWRQFEEWIAVEYSHISVLGQINDDIAQSYAEYLKCERNLAPATFNAHRNLLALITETLARRSGIQNNPWKSIAPQMLDTVEKKELDINDARKLLDKLGDPEFNIGHREEQHGHHHHQKQSLSYHLFSHFFSSSSHNNLIIT